MDIILFNDDWSRFPTAIPHTTTRNKSFLDLAALYKKMGIKNYYFHLALLQPALADVDPFREDLTEEQHAMIKLECIYNPWYFIREILRFPPVSGDKPIQLIANRANISLWWCFLNHIDYYLIQPRQTGKSVNSDGISIWYQLFGAKQSRGNLFTKNADLIKENIARLKKIRKLLPSYLYEIIHNVDTDNQKEFTCATQGNRLVAVQAQANEDAARNVGRGLTAPFNHTDELAFLRFCHISVPVMLAGSGAARAQARENGQPYGNLFTTTAGKIDTEEGKFAYKMLCDGAIWSESYYDSRDKRDLYETVRANCRNKDALLINGTFSHRQLGFDDAWLRERIAEARQTGDEARRDYLNQWTVGTASNPLDTAILEAVVASKREALYLQKYEKEKYIMRWQLPVDEVVEKMPRRQLVMGIDTSNAVGRDAITGVILDVSSLEVVGTLSVSESNLQTFSIWLGKFMEEYQNVTIIPESKSTWIAIQDYLLMTLPVRGIDPGRRIYSQIVDQKDNDDRSRREFVEYARPSHSVDKYTPYRRYFGFPTNGPLRDLLFSNVLQQAAKTTSSVIRDPSLISELSTLTVKNKRIDHSTGKHDDHVISWLMAHWFLTYARNLSHYGIDVAQVRRKANESNVRLSWREIEALREQEVVKAEIDKIVESMGNNVNEIEMLKHEHRLESLYRRMDRATFEDSYGTIDEIKRSARERRDRARNMNNKSGGGTGRGGRDMGLDRNDLDRIYRSFGMSRKVTVV